MQLNFANEFAQIYINQSTNFLQIVWLQHPDSENFRHIISLALRHALEKQLNLWLCDMRKLFYLLMSDQNWLVQEVYPALNPEKQHWLAFIISDEDQELFTSFRIQDLVENNPQLRETTQIEIFFEKSLASDWLLTRIN